MSEFQDKIVAAAFSEVFKRSLDALNKSISKTKKAIVALDLFDEISGAYKKSLEDRYSQVRILGMEKPIPLLDIYTNVNILEKVISYQRAAAGELQEALIESMKEEYGTLGQRRFGKIVTTKPGIEVFSELDKFVILGKPGSGKSTFLKFAMILMLNNEIKPQRIPVFIPLNRLNVNSQSVLDYTISEFRIAGIDHPEEFINVNLKAGNFAILLDGLDEVSDERRPALIQEIVELSDKYAKNKYVVSCRVAAYNEWFERFTDVEIADFKERQIENFIKKWFGGNKQKTTGCISSISEAPSLSELTKTPLLLALICLAYDENQRLSTNRAEIYRDSINALLVKWDATRSIKRDEPYKNLTTKRKIDLFSYIASKTFPSSQYFLEEDKWGGLIELFMKNLVEVDDGISIDSTVILHSIAAQHGLIVERARGVYSFSHLTFHEYFMSLAIDKLDNSQLEKFVATYFKNTTWREVFILTASIMSEADYFICFLMSQMAKVGFNDLHVHKLRSFLGRIQPTGLFGEDIEALKCDETSHTKVPYLRSIYATEELSKNDIKFRLDRLREFFIGRRLDLFLLSIKTSVVEICYPLFMSVTYISDIDNAKFIARGIKVVRPIESEIIETLSEAEAPSEDFKLKSSIFEYRILPKIKKELDGYKPNIEARYTRQNKQVRVVDFLAERERGAKEVSNILKNCFEKYGIKLNAGAAKEIYRRVFEHGNYQQDEFEGKILNGLYMAELMFDILCQPIFIRKETRALASRMIIEFIHSPNTDPDKGQPNLMVVQRSL